MPDQIHSRGILVLGAAGSGTSTLGRTLARQLGARSIDLDTVLWAPTDPPFTTTNPPHTRALLLGLSLRGASTWVLSGSPGAWSDFVVHRLVLAVFLRAPAAVRLGRLRERDAGLHGPAIVEGSACQEAFLRWAALYDEGPPEGRSSRGHEAWLATCPAPVLRLASTRPVVELAATVLAHPALVGLRPDLEHTV